MASELLPALQGFAPFDAVPPDQLEWLAERATLADYPADAVLYSPGEAVDHLVLVLSGGVRLEGGAAGNDAISNDAPAILGVLPFSRMTQSISIWRTTAPTRVATLPRAELRPLTCSCYELTDVLVHQMTSRVRDFTRLTQQTEKLAALGRMSAGLAHELNNPVAAIARTAVGLRDHLHTTPERFKAVMGLRLTPEQTDAVNELLFARLRTPPAHASLLARSRAEDALLDWFDDEQVTCSLDLTGTLADLGFTPDELAQVRTVVGPAATAPVLGWLVSNLITENLVRDIADASQRIGSLVGSMKTYTHMDRGAGRTTVELRAGLESTLTLLAHKAKSKGVRVTLDLPPDLPAVSGWPGDLNQVWTNLLDNALDAVPEQGGEVRISAARENERFVVTRIADNGAGIAPDVQARIFEPFFTTKPIGQGTGLGLDIVQGIVRRHNGSIKVESAPGRTEFAVCLPMEAPAH